LDARPVRIRRALSWCILKEERKGNSVFRSGFARSCAREPLQWLGRRSNARSAILWCAAVGAREDETAYAIRSTERDHLHATTTHGESKKVEQLEL
jgi:hypothetical protein